MSVSMRSRLAWMTPRRVGAAAGALLTLTSFAAFYADPLLLPAPDLPPQQHSLRRLIPQLSINDLSYLGSRRYRDILAGKPLVVLFDQCPVADAGWEGDDDPLGTIRCGEAYLVTYDPAPRNWTASGHNEEERGPSVETIADPEVDPGSRQFSIWGTPFTFTDDGAVYHLGQRVGTIVS